MIIFNFILPMIDRKPQVTASENNRYALRLNTFHYEKTMVQ